jgi:hypothetical protein
MGLGVCLCFVLHLSWWLVMERFELAREGGLQFIEVSCGN